MSDFPAFSSQFTCPQCQAPIAPDSLTCDNCGANIALVSLMAERDMLERSRASGQTETQPLSMEVLVPRLGEYLLTHNYVTEAQLQQALTYQKKLVNGQPAPRLGQALVAIGALSRETLDQAVAERALQLQSALVASNQDLEKRVAERTAELEAALVKLTELNQLKANFVANISHELRTPLAQIKGYNAILIDGTLGPLTTEQTDAMQVTGRAIERLERLINDLIAYSTTAKGQLTLSLHAVSVNALLQRVLDRSAGKAARQHVSLALVQSEPLLSVLADEEKLYWTLLQLTDNAIKFTPSGGQVTISAALEGQRVHIAVRDTGIGIPAQRLEDVFEPFRQLDGSSTRRYGGTGLGLTLVKQIIEAHGAKVLVQSVEGKGSSFSFTLAQPPIPADN